MLKQAEQHEELVPLRLEVEWDKIRLRDTFTWNLHERILQVELFAAQLVEDMGLKAPSLARLRASDTTDARAAQRLLPICLFRRRRARPRAPVLSI